MPTRSYSANASCRPDRPAGSAKRWPPRIGLELGIKTFATPKVIRAPCRHPLHFLPAAAKKKHQIDAVHLCPEGSRRLLFGLNGRWDSALTWSAMGRTTALRQGHPFERPVSVSERVLPTRSGLPRTQSRSLETGRSRHRPLDLRFRCPKNSGCGPLCKEAKIQRVLALPRWQHYLWTRRSNLT